ncbi:atp/gtp-binding protein-related [Anaeramoeba flamelloides]|uniref:Atp/gtp-binding protein-related n=1 Tax=Anaeramoeba flamelloides TaxID=1746091 RepID=A0AAV7ZX76_9EUKA|nr:atp/gtp-binding protein-related [Anaeramoeba flamelloides]
MITNKEKYIPIIKITKNLMEAIFKKFDVSYDGKFHERRRKIQELCNQPKWNQVYDELVKEGLWDPSYKKNNNESSTTEWIPFSNGEHIFEENYIKNSQLKRKRIPEKTNSNQFSKNKKKSELENEKEKENLKEKEIEIEIEIEKEPEKVKKIKNKNSEIKNEELENDKEKEKKIKKDDWDINKKKKAVSVIDNNSDKKKQDLCSFNVSKQVTSSSKTTQLFSIKNPNIPLQIFSSQNNPQNQSPNTNIEKGCGSQKFSKSKRDDKKFCNQNPTHTQWWWEEKNTSILIRKKKLKKIQNYFKANPKIIIGLVGLGGIGKTQLAMSYVSDNIQNYDQFFWFNGENKSTLFNDIKSLLINSYKQQLLNISLKNFDLGGLIKKLKKLLNSSKTKKILKRLIIYDNVDNPTEIIKYIKKIKGYILVTSRDDNRKYYNKILKVNNFSKSETIQYLERELKSLEIENEKEKETENETENENAKEKEKEKWIEIEKENVNEKKKEKRIEIEKEKEKEKEIEIEIEKENENEKEKKKDNIYVYIKKSKGKDHKNYNEQLIGIQNRNKQRFTKKELEDAEKIHELLGGFPLALKQKIEYIKKRKKSMKEFITDFNKDKMEIFPNKIFLWTGNKYNKTLLTVCNLNLRKLEEKNPNAIKLLNYFSYLSPDNISIDTLMMIMGIKIFHEENKNWNGEKMENGNRKKKKKKKRGNGNGNRKHKQIKKGKGEKKQNGNENNIIYRSNSIIFDHINNYYLKNDNYESLLGYFKKTLLKLNRKYQKMEHYRISRILEKIGLIYLKRRDFEKAEMFFDYCLKINKQLYSDGLHYENAKIMHFKGKIYFEKFCLKKSEECFNISLMWNKSIYTNEVHPEIVKNLYNIGKIYYYKKEYKKSLEFFKLCLKKNETMYVIDRKLPQPYTITWMQKLIKEIKNNLIKRQDLF